LPRRFAPRNDERRPAISIAERFSPIDGDTPLDQLSERTARNRI
jgi:hypothetical protein